MKLACFSWFLSNCRWSSPKITESNEYVIEQMDGVDHILDAVTVITVLQIAAASVGAGRLES